ncbi:MAG TPA: TonB-dependent receptor [Bacteroidales bacterium]|nr:TonB-dependent receptor [Bacteroidales bacterium]
MRKNFYKTSLLLFLFFLINLSIFAQKFTISGYVKDNATGEFLIGANVYLKELMKGTTTNTYGFYSITVEKGEYNLVTSFVGYKDVDEKVTLDKNVKLNINLEPNVITTSEVVISGEREDKNTQSTEVGRVEIPIDRIKKLPALLGETDVIKAIQLTPGVQSAGEGNTGFYVRGGGPDQNLILLDEAVVYNASHLLGFFSVFNADALKNAELIKAGMPANYGGRLASVLDISMKEGNNKKFEFDGGIGLISSRLTVQGPIKKEKCSFIVSGRRTYLDLVMQPFLKKDSPFKKGGYYFYDINAKINYYFSDKDRLFLSGYFGKDVFTLNGGESFSNKIDWGNATATVRWNHLFNDKLFLNTTLIYSNYKFNMGAEQNFYEMKLHSGITDYSAKLDFSYLPTIRHNIKFGGQYTYHVMMPNSASARSDTTEFDLGGTVKLHTHEAAIFITDDFDVSEKIKISGGLRYSMFFHTGPFDRYNLNETGIITDTISYKTGELIKMYHGLEPRLSVKFGINSKSSIKASFTMNYQYIHMASYTSVSLPTDIWVPSTSLVKPQIGYQYSLGYFRNFYKNMWETSFEIYYKDMRNQIEFKEGFSAVDNLKNNTDNNFTYGRGWSYGGELFIKKRVGKTTGWIGYTLSWTQRKFPEINGGKTYPAKYDRRHDISIVVTQQLGKRWSISAVWVYATGNAMTLPLSRYFLSGSIVNEYSARNAFRMPAYHRLDISATFSSKDKPGKRFHWDLNLGVYNVYSRMNPYYIYFETTGDLTTFDLKTVAKQVSLFPIIPSVTWNFKF